MTRRGGRGLRRATQGVATTIRFTIVLRTEDAAKRKIGAVTGSQCAAALRCACDDAVAPSLYGGCFPWHDPMQYEEFK